jgi:clan AA aspartic protease
MIEGRVLASGEVVVTIAVRGPNSQARVEAVVDTGFNEQLTLPPWVVEKLGLQFQTQAYYRLADGSKSAARVFSGQLEWHGAWRDVAVVEIEQDALLGTGTIMGSSLLVEMIAGGHVEIRPLPTNGKQ